MIVIRGGRYIRTYMPEGRRYGPGHARRSPGTKTAVHQDGDQESCCTPHSGRNHQGQNHNCPELAVEC